MVAKCVLCGLPLPHVDKCPELERRSSGMQIAPYVNRSAFLDANPPGNFRGLLGDDLFESMKILDSVYPIREVSTGNGSTSVTGSNTDGVRGFRFTREIIGDTQEIDGERYVVVEERRRFEFKLNNEKKSILDRIRGR